MAEEIDQVLKAVAAAVTGVGYAILLFTVAKFLRRYIALEIARVRGFDCARRFRDIRLDLGSHIVLAIDFMVIADVIHTGLVQNRESLINLGLFVLIRSALTFFLGLDMRDIRQERAENQ